VREKGGKKRKRGIMGHEIGWGSLGEPTACCQKKNRPEKGGGTPIGQKKLADLEYYGPSQTNCVGCKKNISLKKRRKKEKKG